MQDCVSVFIGRFSKKKIMNVFQTEIKIKDLNRPVPISLLTFSRKSLSVVVMDLNICRKFIFQ